MKSSNKLKKLRLHLEVKSYCKIYRKVGNNKTRYSNGYVVDCNEDFVVLRESEDFDLKGYVIFSTSSIIFIRFNLNDEYYNRIMQAEGMVDRISYSHKVDLISWATIFTSIKDLGFNVIIENEKPKRETFDIGPITKVKDRSVKIRYFSAAGYLSKKTTKFKWKHITIVRFDDRYINVFSKYLREYD